MTSKYIINVLITETLTVEESVFISFALKVARDRGALSAKALFNPKDRVRFQGRGRIQDHCWNVHPSPLTVISTEDKLS